MAGKLDPNHNEYFDSGRLLEEAFRDNMKQQGVDVPDGIFSQRRGGQVPDMGSVEAEEGSGGDFFITTKPGRKKVDVTSDSGRTERMEVDEAGSEDLTRFAQVVMDCKDRAVGIFEASAGNSVLTSEIEGLIKNIERLEEACGMKVKKFEPLRHMSGLKSRDILENANRVVDNTLSNYDMHVINGIQSSISAGNRPAVMVTVLGEHKGRGFLARASVVAKRDFGGSEAIDYVHASPKGLFSIKRFERNRWVDVSDDFEIRTKVKEYELEKDENMPHSLFVGEKIAAEGKDIIMKHLNLNDENVKFSGHQVFASSQEVVDSIRKTIRAS